MPWAKIRPVPGQHPSRQNIPLRAAASADTPRSRTAQNGGYRAYFTADLITESDRTACGQPLGAPERGLPAAAPGPGRVFRGTGHMAGA